MPDLPEINIEFAKYKMDFLALPKAFWEALNALSVEDLNPVTGASILLKSSPIQKTNTLENQLANIIFCSMMHTLTRTLQDCASYTDFKPSAEDFAKILKAHMLEGSVNATFFSRPAYFTGYQSFKTKLREWLATFSGFQTPNGKQRLDTILDKMDGYFSIALWETWNTDPQKYSLIQSHLHNNPFAEEQIKQALAEIKAEEEWQRYYAWFARKIQTNLPDEPFNVQDIYIPLRGYYQTKPKDTKTPVWVEQHLQTWLNKGNIEEFSKVLSGSPGSGKTTVANLFAYQQMLKGDMRVLVVPLQHVNIEKDVQQALKAYLDEKLIDPNTNKPFFSNANNVLRSGKPFLLVLDGLDELGYHKESGMQHLESFVVDVLRLYEPTEGMHKCRNFVMFTGIVLRKVFETNKKIDRLGLCFKDLCYSVSSILNNLSRIQT